MLSDKQSLILSGITGIGIFVFGIFNLLDNFIVLTLMTISFFAIIINLLYSNTKKKEGSKEQKDQKRSITE